MSKPPAEQITEVGSESAGDPEKAAEQSVEGTPAYRLCSGVRG